jgi:hypothetical protein
MDLLQEVKVSDDLTLTVKKYSSVLQSKMGATEGVSGEVAISPDELRRLIFALREAAMLQGVPGDENV